MSKNIKEIGKELLGKSLNSFHRKTGLTQLEKNNEMQDGILNGILSQVDDAYIEKTEQSNVIHLDGSGDGVVVLDSIEGNTMVNLLKDLRAGSAWVDNGNKFSLNIPTGSGQPMILGNLNYELKKDTVYTVILNVVEYTTGIPHVCFMNKENNKLASTTEATTSSMGLKKFKLTTKSDIDSSILRILPRNGIDNTYSIGKDIIILEGDWTNREIPASYFEGLQSTFEEKVNDEGKYEIEILMKNKNLIDVFQSVDENVKGIQSHMEDGILNLNGTSTGQADFNYTPFSHEIHLLKGKKYRLNFEILSGENSYNLYCRCAYKVTKRDGTIQWLGGTIEYPLTSYIINGDEVEKVSRVRMHSSIEGAIFNNFKVRCQLEISDTPTTYEKPKQNKIKLLLDEPLRAIDDIKDRLCVKDGKLVVERKIKQVTYNGSENWAYQNATISSNNYLIVSDIDLNSKLIVDKVPYLMNVVTNTNHSIEGIGVKRVPDRVELVLNVLKSKLPSLDSNGIKNWISQNNLTVCYQLAEPTYGEVLNEYGEPILLEGYENGTLYIDSTIIPTTTVKYTPKMESFNTLKEVANNNIMLTSDVNDNIIPYMMEVDLMIMEKEMALMSHKNIRKMEVLDMTSMQKRTQDMLERLIKGKSLTEQECKTRVTTYLNAGKITDEQAEELMLLIDEVYA